MANGAIESRLISSLHRGSKKGELDLATKLKIQQKQNSLPQVQFTQPTLEIATDIDKLKSKYIVLTPKERGFIFSSLSRFPRFPHSHANFNWPRRNLLRPQLVISNLNYYDFPRDLIMECRVKSEK